MFMQDAENTASGTCCTHSFRWCRRDCRPTQVVEAKHEKLGGVVRKVFSRMGTIADDGLTHPFDEATGLTKGFAFVNFLNPQDAKQAAATLNGWQLDKSHNIKVRASALMFIP